MVFLVALFCGALTEFAICPAAWVNDMPAREVPRGVTVISASHALPPTVLAALHAQIWTIAPVWPLFDAADVAFWGVNRRFIFVWQHGNQWVIATKRGGQAHNQPILLFTTGSEGKTVIFVKQRIAAPGTVCPSAWR